MAFRVEITGKAKRDLNRILDWLISKEAGDAGLRWFNGLRQQIETLSETPRRCAIAPDCAKLGFEVRHLLYGHRPHIYRILFTIEDDTVFVLHVRHGRRTPVVRDLE